MAIWRNLHDLSQAECFGPSAVTIGNFDGVHRGHAEVLARVAEDADAAGLRSVAVTFDPHPLKVVRPDLAPELLTTMQRRCELLTASGMDDVVVLPFDADMATWSPERFIDDVLVGALRARDVIVGADFRFGSRGSGTVDTLRMRGPSRDIRVQVVDDVRGANRRWSSTWARDLLLAGDVVGACAVLGRPHRVDGTVVHGDHRGRDLGYPTANIDTSVLIPADGVYAGYLQVLGGEGDAERLPAAISIGTNPTFDGEQRRCEAYVLDRDDLDLYGARVGAEFTERLRGTERFDSVDELVHQMGRDVALARELLSDGEVLSR